MNESRRKDLFPNVSDAEWNDWKWQVANRIETLEDLKKYVKLTPEEEEGVKKTLSTLRMAITPYYISLIDPNDPYDPIGIGRNAFTLAAAAIVMGGNVRVGFEDNLNLERGVLAKSNGELVAKVVRIAKELGRPVATSAEAREILSLKK